MASIGGALGSAQAGMQRGMQRMQAAAQAQAHGPSPEAVVQMKLAETEVVASAKVAAIADRSLGRLIDTLA